MMVSFGSGSEPGLRLMVALNSSSVTEGHIVPAASLHGLVVPYQDVFGGKRPRGHARRVPALAGRLRVVAQAEFLAPTVLYPYLRLALEPGIHENVHHPAHVEEEPTDGIVAVGYLARQCLITQPVYGAVYTPVTIPQLRSSAFDIPAETAMITLQKFR